MAIPPALVSVDGVSDPSTSNAVELYYLNHTVYYKNAAGNWFSKARKADAWAVASDPTGLPLPTPPTVINPPPTPAPPTLNPPPTTRPTPPTIPPTINPPPTTRPTPPTNVPPPPTPPSGGTLLWDAGFTTDTAWIGHGSHEGNDPFAYGFKGGSGGFSDSSGYWINPPQQGHPEVVQMVGSELRIAAIANTDGYANNQGAPAECLSAIMTNFDFPGGAFFQYGYHLFSLRLDNVRGLIFHFDIEDYTPNWQEIDLDIWIDSDGVHHVTSVDLTGNGLYASTTNIDVTQTHVYGLDWQAGWLRLYIDDVLIGETGNNYNRPFGSYFFVDSATYYPANDGVIQSTPAYGYLGYYRIYASKDGVSVTNNPPTPTPPTNNPPTPTPPTSNPPTTGNPPPTPAGLPIGFASAAEVQAEEANLQTAAVNSGEYGGIPLTLPAGSLCPSKNAQGYTLTDRQGGVWSFVPDQYVVWYIAVLNGAVTNGDFTACLAVGSDGVVYGEDSKGHGWVGWDGGAFTIAVGNFPG